MGSGPRLALAGTRASVSDRSVRDCSECQSAGSVTGDFCEVCYADLKEWREGPADLPPAAPGVPPDAGLGAPVTAARSA
jgi:hypothetical protein